MYVLGVYVNQVLGRMHGVKLVTENCIQRKIRNIYFSPKSITCAEIIIVWEEKGDSTYSSKIGRKETIYAT
jgi:hypothetical protein